VATAKKWRAAAALTAATIVASGCGSASDDDAGRATDAPLVLELSEQNGSGQAGTATFTRLAGDRTRIVLELTNPPPEPQPAHVHSGSCENLGPPVVPLTNVEDGRSVTETDTPLGELRGNELVIHAHKSEAESDISVACAPLIDGG
jgi:hypothetical protein